MGRDVVIIGGGPSGLAAAYEAAVHGASVSVFERLDIIGGLSRTIPFRGNRFDIGAHRFFTKNAEVRELFIGVLGDILLSNVKQRCVNVPFRHPPGGLKLPT